MRVLAALLDGPVADFGLGNAGAIKNAASIAAAKNNRFMSASSQFPAKLTISPTALQAPPTPARQKRKAPAEAALRAFGRTIRMSRRKAQPDRLRRLPAPQEEHDPEGCVPCLDVISRDKLTAPLGDRLIQPRANVEIAAMPT
jgi:hypothetical protein